MATQVTFQQNGQGIIHRHAVRITLVAWVLSCGLSSAWTAGIPRTGARNAPATSPTVSANTAAAAAAPIQARAKDLFKRSNDTLTALRAAQAAARTAAINGANNLLNITDPNDPGYNVPDGLATGGLNPSTGLPTAITGSPGSYVVPSTWVGVSALTQTTADDLTTVTAVQSQQQAKYYWTTYNIGKKTLMYYDQSAGGDSVGSWVAFNFITDPSGRPSQILGQIKAAGQVYVINQNGIIFGGSSQVNTHALVASSLPINSNLLDRGLLNNPDLQFLFSQLTIPQTTGGTMAAFTPTAPLTANGRNGDVIVQAGALISTPSTTPGKVTVASSSATSTTVTLASSSLPADFGVGSILLGATVTAINGTTVTLASNANTTIAASTDATFYSLGGKVALVGANVKNSGTISTPDGQTILAAGKQVGFKAHDSNDPSLRGLDVYIGQVDQYSGVATNEGIIEAPRANVTIAGKSVNQMGAINGLTSVSLNGSVNLLANYNSTVTYDTKTSKNIINTISSGGVILGENSVTQVLPDLASTETVVGTKLALPSQVTIQGQTIYMAPDSSLIAPNATVSLNAGKWALSGGYYSFVYTGGQIYMDENAAIDVSGTKDVSKSVTDNIISVELRGTELADDPLQVNGVLRGQTVQVDITQTGTNADGTTWVGTPLANLTGYINNIKRTVGELTTEGGTVTFNAGSSVVMQSGSSVDVSGGWINYAAGVIKTTKIVANGRVYDIGSADPNIVYDGIYGAAKTSNSKWGVNEDWSTSIGTQGAYQEGYTQGANAGSISITAPSMALDGKLYGNAVSGTRQRTNYAKSGSLSLIFERQQLVNSTYYTYSPVTPPDITFKSDSSLAAAGAFSVDATGAPTALSTERQSKVDLSPDLFDKGGFSSLTVRNGDGNITVPVGVSLNTPAGGSINLSGKNIDVEGRITAHGGSMNFTVTDYTTYVGEGVGSTPPIDLSRGVFTLGSGAVLDASGLIVDLRNDSGLPYVTKGGTVSINAFTADLQTGSVIDVSGGALVGVTSKVTYGAGGATTIAAGVDPNIASLVGGTLTLGSTLSGYSGTKGASLTIQAPLIQVGGSTSNPLALQLTPDFFNRGGFSSFTLKGLGDLSHPTTAPVTIAANTVINPVALSYLLQANGTLAPVQQPQGIRSAVSLAFSSVGVVDNAGATAVRGDLLMEEGAVIRTDPGASVSFNGQTVSILGQVYAAGGTISVSGKSDSSGVFNDTSKALATVHLGAHSVLSAAGTTLLTPNNYGYRIGSVLDGGKINVSGNIVADGEIRDVNGVVLAPGAILDVSGASDTLDYLPGYTGASSSTAANFGSARMVSKYVESNGGSITLAGGQFLYSDATLLGAAGGSSATGGTLNISSGRFTGGYPQKPEEVTLVVKQSGATMQAGQSQIIGHQILGSDGSILASNGYFTADQFASGGFDNLVLGGTVQFKGAVQISAKGSLTVGSGGVLQADSTVDLSGAYVSIGTAFHSPYAPNAQSNSFSVAGSPYFFAPTYGTGKLNVKADSLIDIGNLSLLSIGSATFVANTGDIRGDGTLNIAGDITMQAGQVYAPTAVNFNVFAYDHGATKGSVTILPSSVGAVRQTPLSAGGGINIYSSIINQGGVLRAPYGSINLGWNGTGTAPYDPSAAGKLTAPTTTQLNLLPGSITSVSGDGVTVPYGTNLNGVSWIDPSGTDITTTGLPGKSISISALNVDIQKDASGENGALLDISGSGDLMAYRWVSGAGGTKDILASSTSFAVIPGYQADYAPVDKTVDSTGATPYVNSTLKVGDKIYLDASSGLPAGYYTLLPARYALLSGAFLVTPKTGTPVSTAVTQPDGSVIVSGYRYNSLNSSRTLSPLYSSFEVASQSVIKARAEYDLSSANTFLSTSATAAQARVPKDSGQLTLSAISSMKIQGQVASRSQSGGRGGMVDIGGSGEILIAAPGATAGTGVLVLDASELSAFGADSLLIGGTRKNSSTGTSVTASTAKLTVDNDGAALTGTDIILVSKGDLIIAANADIEQSGSLSGSADTLLLGSSTVAGSGDGVLVRVGSDTSAAITRAGVSNSTTPKMSIGAGAQISGASVILDSTSRTTLDSTAEITGDAVSLNSGQISLQLDTVSTPNTTGLILTGDALQKLQGSVKNLSLLSYSSIDIYGTGTIGNRSTVESLALHAAQIRGFNNAGGSVTIAAKNIFLDNSPGRSALSAATPATGSLTFDGGKIQLGANTLKIDQFTSVDMNATGGIYLDGTGGVTVANNLNITAPVITGSKTAKQTIVSTGSMAIHSGGTADATIQSGLGATLALQGTSLTADTSILLPSGTLTLRATTGDVQIGGHLDVGGTAQVYYDETRYTNGGSVTITADAGNVILGSGSSVSVAANSGGGNAGTLSISAVNGSFTNNASSGSIKGAAGSGGTGGLFSLDVKALASTAGLDAALNAGSFDLSRSLRVRTGDVSVDGLAKSKIYDLSADLGSITVTGNGNIDASGATGGVIGLYANNGITLASGAKLSVAAADFDSAGKAGRVDLEIRGANGGQISIQSGSSIDLSVTSNTNVVANAALGKSNGTLHLRAPQIAGSDYVAIAPIAGTVTNPGSVLIEGFYTQDANTTGVAAIDDYEAAALANGTSFMTHEAAIRTRLTAGNAALSSAMEILPGEEIINSKGDLVLNNDWDLSTWRFGTKKAVVDSAGNFLYSSSGDQIYSGTVPGILTLKAKGSITFNGALSDGFGNGAGDLVEDPSYNMSLYLTQLLPVFQDGTSQESWSYRLVSGADFSAAEFRRVRALSTLAADSGSIKIGVNASGTGVVTTPITSDALYGNYQVIRTGTGDIEIAAARDIQLLNQFATIYTAGTQVADPTMGGNFDVPIIPTYAAQYSYRGGNVTLSAQEDIEHLTRNSSNVLVADSEHELPNNWLYRRGYVDPVTGLFGVSANGEVASTSWWVDFSNFFEGVGALGGGNVAMTAGNNISNVDAVVPTNVRLAKGSATASLTDSSKKIELGGGNLTVVAGNNIDGGAYYVEHGAGTLVAGNSVTTNKTRTPSTSPNAIIDSSLVGSSLTWLPTTLFLGNSSFDVSARGDVLLGPVANVFLMPQGIGNTYAYKTYFSTYDSASSVSASSLNGSVTLRTGAYIDGVSTPTGYSAVPLLMAWMRNVDLLPPSNDSVSYYQPWLQIVEDSIDPFSSSLTLMASTLRAAAFSSNINLVGDITLSPSSTGNLDLIAGQAINAMQPAGVTTLRNGSLATVWISSKINLSDADPSRIPSITNPYGYQRLVGTDFTEMQKTKANFLSFITNLFAESGSTEGVYGTLETKQNLHDATLLHSVDTEPLRLYALNGDISGLTLFSSKAANIFSGQDITDIAFYLQNLKSSDVTRVVAGRDIIAYNTTSALRTAAASPSNIPSTYAAAKVGDIQIGGPGTLEVLAGRNFNLGVGKNNADGTGLGITSIGNARNLALPFVGADIVVGAGLGSAYSLGNSQLDFTAFIAQFLDPATAGTLATRYLAQLATLMGMDGTQTWTNTQIWDRFQTESDTKKNYLALDVFYHVLRDAGRDHNNPSGGNPSDYSNGYAALKALFPTSVNWKGDISLTSRQIKTKSGGDISLFSPGGALNVGFDILTNAAANQGILTEHGGNISIFANNSVNVGTSRIFTLRGGNIIIWSTLGDIAAGASSKTVQSAPPTRVLIDTQSADVQTDLAGLATGGGIGVLATVTGVPPGDVDLIAPTGAIDAGDAGIRSAGNVSLSANRVLNASNIQSSGTSAGVPATVAPSLNLGSINTGNTTTAASNAAAEVAQKNQSTAQSGSQEIPSIFTVEVIGYGG